MGRYWRTRMDTSTDNRWASQTNIYMSPTNNRFSEVWGYFYIKLRHWLTFNTFWMLNFLLTTMEQYANCLLECTKLCGAVQMIWRGWADESPTCCLQLVWTTLQSNWKFFHQHHHHRLIIFKIIKTWKCDEFITTSSNFHASFQAFTQN